MTEHGVSPLPRQARVYQGRRAGLVTRVLAASIDTVLVLLAMFVGYFLWAGLRFLVDPRGFRFPELGPIVSGTSMLAILVVYLTVSWRVSGRTYGSLVMGVRVVGPGGRGLTLPTALARALFYAVVPIGLFWVAVNRENRSLQDVVLRTSVVYDWLPHEPGAALS